MTLQAIKQLSLNTLMMLENSDSHEEVVRGAFNIAQKAADLWKQISDQYPKPPYAKGVSESQEAVFIACLTTPSFEKNDLINMPAKHQIEFKEFVAGFAKKSIKLADKLSSNK